VRLQKRTGSVAIHVEIVSADRFGGGFLREMRSRFSRSRGRRLVRYSRANRSRGFSGAAELLERRDDYPAFCKDDVSKARHEFADQFVRFGNAETRLRGKLQFEDPLALNRASRG